MGKPHKHADLIKAWADGAEIEYRSYARGWEDCIGNRPDWSPNIEYRIKPEPKPDVVLYMRVIINENAKPKKISLGVVYDVKEIFSMAPSSCKTPADNLKLTFDGDTGKLKSAEVINE